MKRKYIENEMNENLTELEKIMNDVTNEVKLIAVAIEIPRKRLKFLQVPERTGSIINDIEYISLSEWFTIVYEEVIAYMEDYDELMNLVLITAEEAYLLFGKDVHEIDIPIELLGYLEAIGISVEPAPSSTYEIENPAFNEKMAEHLVLSRELLKLGRSTLHDLKIIRAELH